jgi:hypothetical protein
MLPFRRITMQKRSRLLSVFLVFSLLMSTISLGGCGGASEIEVTIIAPSDGDSFDEFNPVTFTGTAVDEEDGALGAGSLVWTSDVAGEIGTGTSITIDDLPAGTHTIELAATDPDGNMATAGVSITINLCTGLIPRGHDFMDNYYSGGCDFQQSEVFWASATVRGDDGLPITGLQLEDFTLTEAITTLDGEAVSEPREISIALEKEHDWEPQWFWERTVSDEKLDIVLLVDRRGTMSDAMPGIRSEVWAFIDRLKASYVDFRVAGVGFWETPSWDYFDFYGPGEIDRLEQGIDQLFSTGGTAWNPAASYDALVWTPWIGFREKARKICVIIDDIPPQTVYDAFWHAVSCTAMTRSAVELFLSNHPDMGLYYCLNPDEDVDYDLYVDPEINPMAGNALDEDGLGGGFAALESEGFATGIPWPFDQSDLPLTDAPIADSRYYFVWETSLTWDDVPDGKENPGSYEVRVTAEVTLPDTGETVSTVYSYPLTKEEPTLTINFADERGNALYDSIWADMYYPVGGRMYPYTGQLYSRDGPVVVDVAEGTYHLLTVDGGSSEYDYRSLRAIDRRLIEVPPGGATIAVQVDAADREMELVKARGLLRDLKYNWRQPGDPFREFVAEAEAWLDEVDRDGIDFVNMVRVKRFYIALSGYANLVEYAQMEIDKSVQNVEDIIDDMYDIIAEVEALHETTEFDWDEALGVLLEIVYDVLTGAEFTIHKEAVETGLEELLEYAGGELLEDLKDLVCDELADKDYKDLICTLITVTADLPKAAAEDWSIILDPLQQLAFDMALDQARSLVAGDFVDDVFGELELSDPLEKSIGGLVKDIPEALMSEEGFDNFDEVLEEFSEGVVQQSGEQFYAENREQVAAAVDSVFEQLKDEADELLAGQPGSGFVRDFLLGIGQDMALAALPKVDDNGSIDYKPDVDALATVLIKHTLYHVFLEDYFVDEVTDGLYEALDLARDYVPEGGDLSDWEESMFQDMFDYRKIVEDLQDTAWDALETQEDIQDWASALETLVAILEPISTSLDFLGAIYPPLQDTAEEVDTFISVLDGIQIVSTAVELALRVDSLDTFGNVAEELALTAFGEHE